ncbi:MAG: hypothetical protein WBL63_21945 [Candidatus Acidiferrum sp.]
MSKLSPFVIMCLGFALVLIGCSQGSSSAPTSGGPPPPPVSNVAELSGNYAFTFNGITGGPGYSVVFGAVGRFTADGAGNLTNGEVDTNGIGAGAVLPAQTFTGTYSIGPDHRGVMSMNIPGGAKLAFAMMANGNAHFIEVDATGGTGTIGSGTIEKVDTTAYNAASINGNYAFGLAGLDSNNARSAIVGRLTADGVGTFSNGAADANSSGGSNPVTVTAANYSVSDTTTGRGRMGLALTNGTVQQNLHFVFYIVNAGKLFAMGSDAVAGSTPLLNGSVLRQQIPANGFTNASFAGDSVIYLTGLSVCTKGSGAAPNVFLGLLTADGNGALTMTYDQNCGGSSTSSSAQVGTYNVASDGRTSILAGGAPGVLYLTGSNSAFILGSDSSVLFGFAESQSASSFTNAQLSGAYAGLASTPITFGVTSFSGEFSADGASPTGNITGSEDICVPAGPMSGMAFKATYSVTSSPANGRGTMTVKSGPGGNAVVYLISNSRFVAASMADANPAVMIFDQAPPP